MIRTLFVGLILVIMSASSFSQSNSFTGTFANYSMSLQLKPMGNEYHGMLTAMGSSFALKGKVQNNQLTGTLYGLNGPVAFTAGFSNGMLALSSGGYTENLVLISTEHNLQQMDLTPYMTDARQQQNQNQQYQGQQNAGTGDFNHSYSAHNEGNATERYSSSNQASPNNARSPYTPLNDQQILNIVKGAQLVYYTRTSYLNDNTASTITYVNFCANGTFSINYDGSFMVEGSYGGNAQGASYGQSSGRWELVNYQGQPALYMMFNDGTSTVNPFNRQNVIDGRWRIGNTQYALVRNKVHCQ